MVGVSRGHKKSAKSLEEAKEEGGVSYHQGRDMIEFSTLPRLELPTEPLQPTSLQNPNFHLPRANSFQPLPTSAVAALRQDDNTLAAAHQGPLRTSSVEDEDSVHSLTRDSGSLRRQHPHRSSTRHRSSLQSQDLQRRAGSRHRESSTKRRTLEVEQRLELATAKIAEARQIQEEQAMYDQVQVQKT